MVSLILNLNLIKNFSYVRGKNYETQFSLAGGKILLTDSHVKFSYLKEKKKEELDFKLIFFCEIEEYKILLSLSA